MPTQEVVIQPGQTNNINIILTNQGSLSGNNVVAELIYLGNSLTINDNFGAWGNIDPGEELNSINSFNIL